MGVGVLAGLIYLIRRRLKTRSGRDGIQVLPDDKKEKTRSGRDGTQAYLDDKKELHANQKIVHENYELARGSRPLELSEQGLVELQ